MKKFLIGCAIFGLVACILVCACAGFVIYKGGKWATNIQTSIEKTAKIDADYPYTAPELGSDDDAARFDDYLAIRQKMISRTTQAPLFGKMMTASKTGAKPNIGMGDVFDFMGELPKMIDDLGVILREKQMSLTEYGWHARVVLKAIKDGSDAGNPKMQELWMKIDSEATTLQNAIDQNNAGKPSNQQVRINLLEEIEKLEMSPASSANVAMVEEHLDKFSEPAALWLEIILVEILQNTLRGMLAPPR